MPPLPESSRHPAAVPSEELRDYLAISQAPFAPAEGILMATEIDGWWYGLRRPLDQWPPALLKKAIFDLGWVFPELGNRTEIPPIHQKICLCLDVAHCRFKENGVRENRDCTRYGHGICSEATWNATGGKQIAQSVLAFFYGMSFKQLRVLQEECVRGWIQDILADPVLREYIEHLGLNS